MTKKDYIAIASKIKSTKNTYSSTVARAIVDDLAIAMGEVMQEDNPNFDSNKFLTACGFEFKV